MKFRKLIRAVVCVQLMFLYHAMAFAEGSKDLYPSGATGNRAWLISTTQSVSTSSQVNMLWPNPGRHFIYAEPGEVIHVGSSAQGFGAGTINIWSPTGVTYTSGSGTTGRILNRAQELVGPTLDGGIDGGYTAYTITVGAGQGGLWVVEFRGIINTEAVLNANALSANASWTFTDQTNNNGRYIIAWDATVVKAGVRQTGRLFQRAFTADLGNVNVQLSTSAKFTVLSRDGFRYLVEPQSGFQPWLFAIFANNKGVRYNSGANLGKSAYVSAPNTSVENAIQDPVDAAAAPYDYHIPMNDDDATNVTHKLFYNSPSTDLPDSATYYASASSLAVKDWLRVAAPPKPELTNLALVGVEGTSGFGTGALAGGYIKFTANIAGGYRILIDASIPANGVYTDAEDVVIRGDAVAGANSVFWDGKNGLGAQIASGTSIQISAVTQAGEVHFPLVDAEKNVNGIKITREATVDVAADDKVYWDDRLLGSGTGAASPKTNIDISGGGASSATNGHKWGTVVGGGGVAYGDKIVMDTWTNVFSDPKTITLTLTTREADLETVSVTPSVSSACVGSDVSYTFSVRNNGPNGSGDATVSFVMPSQLNNLSIVSSTVTSGSATIGTGSFAGNTFSNTVNMANGAVVTFVLKGAVASAGGGTLSASARILRAADVTDPDATNSDAAPPTDPVDECNGAPSGAGCNNIVNNTAVTVSAAPSAAVAGSNQSLCNTSTFSMNASAPTTGTGAWSLVSGTGTITDASLRNTTVTGVPVGTSTVLRWTVTNGVCAASTQDVTITNNATPSTANAGGNQALCNTSTFTMNATAPVVGTGAWSLVSGTATITDPSSRTTTITGVGSGSTVTLRWTVSNGACAASTQDITVTNTPLASTANAGGNQTLCNTGTFTMNATAPVVGTGAWSLVSGAATITDLSSRTTTVTGVTAGSSVTLRWTVTNGVCSNSQDIVLTNNALPSTANAGGNQTLCNTSTFTMNATAPATGTGAWTLVSGTATITDASSRSTTITGVPAGSAAVLRWSVTNGVCAASTQDILLTNSALPSTADAGSNQTLCNTSTFTMNAAAPTTGTGAWSIVSGTATITDASARNTTVTGVGTGLSVTLRWTVTNGACASTQDVTLTNVAPPSVANAGSNQSLCNTSTFTMNATAPGTGTGAWSIVSGTATITDASLRTTTVTGVAAGTSVVLRWSVSNGICAASTSDVTITNTAPPSAANAGSNQALCNTSGFTMNAAAPLVGTGAWSIVSGTATITDASSRTTTVTGVTAGTSVVLRWTVSNGTCVPTTSDVTLTNVAPPSAASAGGSQTLCNTSTFTMNAGVPATGTGAWSIVSGTAMITDPSARNTTVTGVAAGTTVVLRWTVSNGICTSSSQDISITNNALPSAAVAGSNQALCNTSTFTMNATAPIVGVGAWSLVSGTATITDPSSRATTITGVPAGTSVVLRWTVSNGVCAPNTNDVTVTNVAPASVANAGSNQSLCNTSTFTMNAAAPVTGTGAWSIVSGTATITDATSRTTTITGVNAGSAVVLRWTVTNGICSSSADVTLTNGTSPSAAVAGPDQVACNNATFTMNATAPVAGIGAWTIVSGTAAITDVSSPTTTVTGVTAGTTVRLKWTVSSGSCPANTAEVLLTNNAGVSPAVAGADQTLCNTANFTLAATAPVLGTGSWSIVTGTAVIADASSATSAVTGVALGASVRLRWTVAQTGCVANTADVVLSNNAPPSVANAGVDQSKCNNGNFTLNATAPTIGTGTWSIVSGTATIADPSSVTSTVTGVAAGTSVRLRWTVSSGTCPASVAEIVLTNNAGPSAAIAGSNQVKCNESNFVLSATAPATGSGAWSLVSGVATIADAASASSAVSHVAAGTSVTLRWTVGSPGCTSNSADVILTNNSGPSAAVAGISQAQCNNAVFVLNATTPATGTGAWSVVSGTAVIADATSSSTQANVTAGTTAVLRWTVSAPGCSSNTSDISLTNYQAPSTAVAGANQEQCNNGNFTLAATVPGIGTGVWSLVSGTAVIANTALANTTVTGVPAGSIAILRWTVSNGNCASSTSDVVLTNNAGPSAAVVSGNLSNCNSGSFTLNATSPTAGTGTWSVASGAAVITNPALPNTTATGVPTGTSVTLRWTVSMPGCISNTSDIVLTNYAPPSTAQVASNRTQNCNSSTFNLSATAPVVGTGAWSLVSGDATITNATALNTTATGVTAGTTAVVRWTVQNGNCTANFTDIVLVNAAAVNAGADTSVSCSATIALSPAAAGQAWRAVAGNPALASISNTGVVTGMQVKGSYRFVLDNNICTDTIVVVRRNCPPAALNDTITIKENEPHTGTVQNKGSDPDNDPIVFSVDVPPTNGSVMWNPDGTYTYTPTTGFNGTDSITYRVCDAEGACTTAKIFIIVLPVPRPPIAIDDTNTTTRDTPVSGTVLSNDYDPKTNTNTGLTTSMLPGSVPAHGSVVLSTNGQYTYTPEPGYTGLDSFQYVTCNPIGLCDTAMVRITITPPAAPQLKISKSVSPTAASYGVMQQVTYTLVAKNTGSVSATPVQVVDALPAGKFRNLAVVAGSPSKGSALYDAAASMINWSIGTLNAGESVTLSYSFTITDTGKVINTAIISNPGGHALSDTVRHTIEVVDEADVRIKKELRAPQVIAVKDEIGFTIIAENYGPSVATELVISDSLWDNLEDPRSLTVSRGTVSFDPASRKITWHMDTLLVGQKDSLVIRMRVIAGGEIRNGATASAKQSDPVGSNNGSVATSATGGQVVVEGLPFFIPSVFTPNKDGKNDNFRIMGIEKFPGSELVIYNRWGNVVFQSKDYRNEWTGEGLNEGVYYYALNLKTSSGYKRMAGWVQLLR